MRVKLSCLSFLFLCVTTFAFANDAQVAMQNNSDLYWLSYAAGDQGTFLMQIDSTGRIVRAPTLVSNVFVQRGGTTISLNGADKINLWGDNQRSVINEETLRLVKTVKTTIAGPDSVTQKIVKNFAAVAEPQLSLRFFAVSRTGVPNGATWKISPSDKGFCAFITCLPGTVSSDGKTVFWIVQEFNGTETTDILYVQALLDTGRPDGLEKAFGSEEAQVTAIDISNVMPGGQIHAIYLLQNRKLILQAVNAQTGQTIGDRVVLRKKIFGYFNNAIAIDPIGRFVVYYHEKNQNGFLSFLALDATGHPSAKAKVLVRKVSAYDIHLLKD